MSRNGDVNGSVLPGYEGVRIAFAENLASGLELGTAFSVYRDGAKIVDLWGGRNVAPDDTRITEDALFGIFSSTKGATAICIAILVDRGLLDYETPVAVYWPEFAQGGKAAITVGEMMSHQAGLVGMRAPVTFEDFVGHDRAAALLAAQEPYFWPGAFGYHALTIGTLADELVRRTDGRTLGDFFAQEVRAKFDIDVFLGLPAEEDSRSVSVISAMDDSTMVYDRSHPEALIAMANSMNIPGEPNLWPNNRRWREAGLPGAGGMASARGLARLYALLVSSDPDGPSRLLSRAVLAQATRERAGGVDVVMGGVHRYAAGFALNCGTMGSNNWSFGHAGFGGSMGFADPARRLGVGYTSNKMLNPDWQAIDPRLQHLLRALYKAEAAIDALNQTTS